MDTVHPVTGHVGRYSLYDRFHESNHKEWDAHLRKLDNTSFEGRINTQSSEQQNHVISLSKSYVNQMNHDTFVNMIMYLTCKHNREINLKWKKRVEKETSTSTEIDDLGFLVRVGVVKEDVKFSRMYGTAANSDVEIQVNGELATIRSPCLVAVTSKGHPSSLHEEGAPVPLLLRSELEILERYLRSSFLTKSYVPLYRKIELGSLYISTIYSKVLVFTRRFTLLVTPHSCVLLVQSPKLCSTSLH